MKTVQYCMAEGCRETDENPLNLLRCGQCKGWFCHDHIDTSSGVALMRDRQTGKGFAQAICYPCKRNIT